MIGLNYIFCTVLENLLGINTWLNHLNFGTTETRNVHWQAYDVTLQNPKSVYSKIVFLNTHFPKNQFPGDFSLKPIFQLLISGIPIIHEIPKIVFNELQDEKTVQKIYFSQKKVIWQLWTNLMTNFSLNLPFR